MAKHLTAIRRGAFCHFTATNSKEIHVERKKNKRSLLKSIRCTLLGPPKIKGRTPKRKPAK